MTWIIKKEESISVLKTKFQFYEVFSMDGWMDEYQQNCALTSVDY